MEVRTVLRTVLLLVGTRPLMACSMPSTIIWQQCNPINLRVQSERTICPRMMIPQH